MFTVGIILLQITGSASLLAVNLLYQFNVNMNNEGTFDILFQILTNLIFIGISAEFFTAFQFLGCIAEFRHGQEKRKTVDKVKCIIFGYFYVSVGIFQLILHRYLKDKLIAVLRVVRQLFVDSAF